jgi:hypothetical protein
MYMSEGCVVFYSSECVIEVAKEDALLPKAVTTKEVDR